MLQNLSEQDNSVILHIAQISSFFWPGLGYPCILLVRSEPHSLAIGQVWVTIAFIGQIRASLACYWSGLGHTCILLVRSEPHGLAIGHNWQV